MSALSTIAECRGHCLDALERLIGEQPTGVAGRAALVVIQHCLKHVTKLPELESLYHDLDALAPESARAPEAAEALAVGGGLNVRC